MQSYPGRLHHRTPSWVESGATFHIRINVSRETSMSLTQPEIASRLLASAHFYHEQARWHCRLFLLMPNHLHALLIFPFDRPMHTVIAPWKAYHAKHLKLPWQNNFFDHRLRNRKELLESETYIRENPVRRRLCESAETWPWVIACAE